MALMWDFRKDYIGYIKYKPKSKEANDKIIANALQVNCYRGNALFLVLNEYREEGKDMYSLKTFFADIQHLKNCTGQNQKSFPKTEEELKVDYWFKNYDCEFMYIVLNPTFFNKKEISEITNAFMLIGGTIVWDKNPEKPLNCLV